MAQIKYMDTPQKRKKRRKAGNTRWIMVLLFLVLCLLAGYYFAQSSFFNVSEILVEGENRVKEERIIELSGLRTGGNIFAIHTNWAKSLVAFDPMIAEVSIKRKLPSTIVIAVTERVPVAFLQSGNSFWQVDADGVALGKLSSLDDVALPMISGVDDITQAVQPGGKIESAQLKTGLEIVAQMAQMNDEVMTMIGEIYVKNMQKIKIFTANGVEGRFGNSDNFADKFNIFTQIIAEQEKNGKLENIQYIDVSASLKEKAAISYYN